MKFLASFGALGLFILSACATSPLGIRGTGDLGVVIERASGRISIVEHSQRSLLARVTGLGDLSHASVVFSRDARFAYIFGRDGGLSKVDLVKAAVVARTLQAGNSIGGAISQSGRVIAVSNYEPGGVRLFSADTLEPLSEVATPGSKTVGVIDVPGEKFVFSTFENSQIFVIDASDPRQPVVSKFPAGKNAYDAAITPDGRYYLAGLFGEDGLTLLDLWHPERGTRTILPQYGKGQEKLPVFKMPHLEGWGMAGRLSFLPAVGRHEILVVDTDTFRLSKRIPVAGQPVFAVVSPDGRQIWVNFAIPDNHKLQVIDGETLSVVKTWDAGKGVLHMEFTPKGDAVWVSARDENRVDVYSTRDFSVLSHLPMESPSGIFFTSRAHRIGL